MTLQLRSIDGAIILFNILDDRYAVIESASCTCPSRLSKAYTRIAALGSCAMDWARQCMQCRD